MKQKVEWYLQFEKLHETNYSLFEKIVGEKSLNKISMRYQIKMEFKVKFNI